LSGTEDREASRLKRQEMLAALNHKIRDGLIDPFDRDDEQRCEFVCECGELDCTEHLLLPPVLYDSLKEDDVGLFADGHPVTLARQARIAARDLQASARALQAQSRVQLHRARRLRGKPDVVTVHVPNLFAGSDLAWSLTDPVEISEGPEGVELTVEITTTLAETLSHVRDWARRYGLASIDVNVHGEAKTLVT